MPGPVRDRAWMAEVACGQRGRMEQDCLGNRTAIRLADTYAVLETNGRNSENVTYNRTGITVDSMVEQHKETVMFSL